MGSVDLLECLLNHGANIEVNDYYVIILYFTFLFSLFVFVSAVGQYMGLDCLVFDSVPEDEMLIVGNSTVTGFFAKQLLKVIES
jgi:hypothetical protein